MNIVQNELAKSYDSNLGELIQDMSCLQYKIKHEDSFSKCKILNLWQNWIDKISNDSYFFQKYDFEKNTDSQIRIKYTSLNLSYIMKDWSEESIKKYLN